MANQKLQDYLAAWEVLQATAQTEIADVTHSAADLAELERLIQAGKDLEVRRAALRETLAKASRERRDLVRMGGETYQRLSLSLRAKLGPKNETLLRFGVAPKKAARRRKGTTPAPVEGQPPATAGPASSTRA